MGTSYCCPKCDARRGPWIQKVRRRHVRRLGTEELTAQLKEDRAHPDYVDAWENADVSPWDLAWIWKSAWNWAHPEDPYEDGDSDV
jgi:hypothetical protein